MAHPAIPERHRNMRVLLAEMVQRVPHDDRTMLQRLTVFPGAFDRDAARCVADAPPLRLLTLSQYSLLAYEGEGRYAVTALVRRYLAGQPIAPDEVAPTRARHADYYAGIVASCARGAFGEPPRWQAIEAHGENVQTALLIAMHEGMATWYAHTGRIAQWGEAFGRAVGAARRTTDDEGADADALGWLLVGQGRAQMRRCRYRDALDLFAEARDRARAMDMAALEGWSLLGLGEALHALDDPTAGDYSREALARAEAAGFLHLEIESLLQLGVIALAGDARHEAAALFGRALVRYRDVRLPCVGAAIAVSDRTAFEEIAPVFLSV